LTITLNLLSENAFRLPLVGETIQNSKLEVFEDNNNNNNNKNQTVMFCLYLLDHEYHIIYILRL